MYWYFPTDSLSMLLYFAAIAIMIVSLVLQFKVKSTFRQYDQIRSRRGITGAQAAEMVLRKNGVYNVQILQTPGELTDHYDPRNNTINLSQAVYSSTSVAAVGVAAHEAGHAVQYALGYGPIKARAAILPVVQFSSSMAFPIALIGFALSWTPLIYFGILLYAAVTLFQLITLPVELDASRRALAAIGEPDMLDPAERQGARKVLTMAAMTYVAALAASVIQLLRLLASANRRR